MLPRHHCEKNVGCSAECFVVPNIVHYIMLRLDNSGYDQNMTFLQYLSFLGVHQHIRPTHVIIHGNVLPRGEWWRRTTNDVANIFFVNVTAHIPTSIYGRTLSCIEHRTDILRYRILYGRKSKSEVRLYYRPTTVRLNGLVVSGHLEFELGDLGPIPVSRHY